jgi:D-amino-acid dehydrogenase
VSDIVVIGGGVIGAFIAYELALRRARVTLLESRTLGSAASSGNAGLIVPSYSVPMANPTSIRMGLRALFKREDAIRIGLRLDLAHWAWLAQFMAACRSNQVSASTALLCELSSASMDLYHQLFEAHPSKSVGFERRGWLYVYRTIRAFHEGIAQARFVGQFGVPWEQLSESEVLELEPALAPGLAGGIFYPGDGSLDPSRLVRFVGRLAEESGARIETGVTVQALKVRNCRVQAAITNEADVNADAFVVAAGVSTPALLADVLPRLPVQPAKGYSITFSSVPDSPRTPLNLAEAHVVVSPLGHRVPPACRLTGGLDLVGLGGSMNSRRLDGIWRAAHSYLPGLDRQVASERWYGFRPMTPDGMPIIGPLDSVEGLIVATGHGTLGMTLGPITGRLVADLITTKSFPAPMKHLLPSRFGLRRTRDRSRWVQAAS